MKPVPIKKDIYWVGAIDWDIRNFHGYLTQEGTTYNAYLIIDEKITLIDTVKPTMTQEMFDRIAAIVDPAKIDFIVSNHVEMDHSGALPAVMERAPNATVICSPKGEKGLKQHYKEDWNFQVVKSGDTVNIGKRNLSFVLTPMVHWPDNMLCYCADEKILFSNDAFGQHLATSERFDDEYPLDIITEQARKYYANIVLPYSEQVKMALKEAGTLDIEIIAPSHGIIWRTQIEHLLNQYSQWSNNQTENKALIIYDTMWKSTEKIARAIQNAFDQKNIKTRLLNLKCNHISDIMTEILTAKYICVGSPTLNKNMLPTVAAFLTYLKGLAPKGRKALAFGSYGWGGHGIEEVHQALEACKFDLMDQVKVQYVPDEEQLTNITDNIAASIE